MSSTGGSDHVGMTKSQAKNLQGGSGCEMRFVGSISIALLLPGQGKADWATSGVCARLLCCPAGQAILRTAIQSTGSRTACFTARVPLKVAPTGAGWVALQRPGLAAWPPAGASIAFQVDSSHSRAPQRVPTAHLRNSSPGARAPLARSRTRSSQSPPSVSVSEKLASCRSLAKVNGRRRSHVYCGVPRSVRPHSLYPGIGCWRREQNQPPRPPRPHTSAVTRDGNSKAAAGSRAGVLR